MKRVILTVASFALLAWAAPAAQATEVGNARRFGLGFQVGDPTALIGKAWLGGDNALDFGVGFRGYGYGWCYDRRGDRYRCGGAHQFWSIHGDFLWQQPIVRTNVGLDWHIGPGARVYFLDNAYADDVWLAARMPLGLDLNFNRPNFLEVFVEIVPSLFVVPFVDFTFDAALGVRFYF